MKITSSRKDDIIRDRDDWDSRNNTQKAKHEAQYDTYRGKEREVFNSIQTQVVDLLSGCDINLDVRVERASFDFKGVKVNVSSEQNNVHGKDKALSWDWSVFIDSDGNPSKDSSSWSGLQATTPEHIKSLKETVKAIEILNDIDWNHILNVTLPEWKDYITEPSDIGQRPKFESDLFNAELEELIGTNTLIKGTRADGRGTVWYNIISASPKQYRVVEIAGYEVEQGGDTNGTTLGETLSRRITNGWDTRITKEKFESLLRKPIETMEV